MRVLVTGGTGFVGSHTVAALLRQGHEVRLLARSPDRVPLALGHFGVQDVEVVRGDAGDPESVERAMDGMQALLHGAAVYSLDSRAEKRLRENATLARNVLGAAAERGLDPIVYVSSNLALVPAQGRVLGPDSPVGTATLPYARSKAEGEKIARDLQAQGAPVVSIYPGGVWGPHDPNFGEQAQLAANILRERVNLAIPGGFSVVDVRDLSEAIGRSVEPGRGPRRYMIAGTYLDFVDLIAAIAEATGRKIPARRMPLLMPVARVSSLLQKVLPVRLPWNFEGAQIIMEAARCDDSLAQRDLGFRARDVKVTIRDTIAWLYEAGYVSASHAGRLAGAPGTVA